MHATRYLDVAEVITSCIRFLITKLLNNLYVNLWCAYIVAVCLFVFFSDNEIFIRFQDHYIKLIQSSWKHSCRYGRFDGLMGLICSRHILIGRPKQTTELMVLICSLHNLTGKLKQTAATERNLGIWGSKYLQVAKLQSAIPGVSNI